MDISKVIELINNPQPFSKGTHTMWTDKYISTILLQSHLDLNNNSASRNYSNIQKTISLIIDHAKNGAIILDLGCGPGLYTERLTLMGYDVTGIDFSLNSINYAEQQAKIKKLNIKYINSDYLSLDFEEYFDVIIMIYCDFGALNPNERQRLIKKIFKALKKGGSFIFDVLNEDYAKDFINQNTYEFTEKGFWSPEPYLSLNSKTLFTNVKSALDQYLIITNSGEYKLYRFWNSYFNSDDIKKEFSLFSEIKEYFNLLKDAEPGNNEEVVFYCIKK